MSPTVVWPGHALPRILQNRLHVSTLLRLHGRAPVIADFFTQTPLMRRLDGLDFYPIYGNFGTDVQEFHIGMASAAVPGMVAGLFALHGRHASMPMELLLQPAIALARAGVVLNGTQAEALRILEPIVRATSGSARLFGLVGQHDALPEPGQRVANPDLADCFQYLAEQGADAFYRGDIAARIAQASVASGGQIGLQDLSRYRVLWRRPMKWTLADATVWSNPPPAFGGLMVALMTGALERGLPRQTDFGSPAHIEALAAAMRASDQQRLDLERPECLRSSRVLKRSFEALLGTGGRVSKGTTHISVRDRRGNLAGMTISNGEGCGQVIPGCGFMLNNMLGEQDLNRLGFHQWPVNRRLSTMMAPTLVRRGEVNLVLGSGGSNRIRTAIAQVLCNTMHFGMDLKSAIEAPRLHLENDVLAIEMDPKGWPKDLPGRIRDAAAQIRFWPARSLFFGGVNAVSDVAAAADPRRQGAAWEECI
ncbi:MAG: gamma-glutamyltransferase [Xanthomonadaceae bacterium]|nr:gamma-glutamyltransferase [Xanthomonadaceae bacterium]